VYDQLPVSSRRGRIGAPFLNGPVEAPNLLLFAELKQELEGTYRIIATCKLTRDQWVLFPEKWKFTP